MKGEKSDWQSLPLEAKKNSPLNFTYTTTFVNDILWPGAFFYVMKL